MKIISVNFSGSRGGAGIAGLRLHQALYDAGVDCEYWCARQPVESAGVYCIQSVFAQKVDSIKCIAISRVNRWLKYDSVRSFNILPSKLVHQLNSSDADVIHLHWVNAEMISIAQMAKIKKPVVWTFHDMWPFCGAEHYTMDKRYVTGYQKAEVRGRRTADVEQATDNQRLFADLDRWTFLRKQKYWKDWHPHVVCVSNWLADCVRQSALMKHLPIKTIFNGLDTQIFKPGNKLDGRRRFNFPLHKKLILFGAFGPSDRRKGLDLLAEALTKVKSGNTELVVFGADRGQLIAEMPIHWMGSISETETLIKLYNACDVVCVPSRMETFGQTASEPLACGVPVVAFGATGLCEVIDHKVNGYLAAPYDVEDMARGIDWVLCEADYDTLCLQARKKAERCFDGQHIAQQYLDVYKAACAR